MTINCNGNLIDLSQPKIMGILNLTPDSFFDGGKYNFENSYLKKVESMLEEGADFIDIGGQSTRPNAKFISAEEETKRCIPAIEKIILKFPEIFISIDTFHSQVAKEAIETGACMVNDVSAGNLDKKMFDTVAKLHVPYVAMHMNGTPKTMQQQTDYQDVILEVNQYFSEKLNQLRALKVNDVILDPGFGFGKTLEQNYQILNNLDLIGMKQAPILVGLSRKSMIYKALKSNPENALFGTQTLNTIALLKGANILRVHDVKPAKDLIKLLPWLK